MEQVAEILRRHLYWRLNIYSSFYCFSIGVAKNAGRFYIYFHNDRFYQKFRKDPVKSFMGYEVITKNVGKIKAY